MVPAELLAKQTELRALGCQIISADKGGELNLPRPLRLPSNYELADAGSGFSEAGTNPWAEACDDTPYLVGWAYTAVGAEGLPATVTIVRTALAYDIQDVSRSQVSTTTIGGREAAVISPASDDGLGQRTLVYFGEGFGHTAIHAFNLPKDEVLALAEAVAEASK